MGHLSNSVRKEEDFDDFVNKLAKDIVEDAVLDAAFHRSESSNESEDSDELYLPSKTQHFKTGAPLDVRIIDFFFKAFTPRNMAKYLVFLLALMLSDTLWNFIADVYSRPTILKPKGPRPFFSNSSNTYLTDYYTGDFRPDRALQHTNLLIAMYYAPWSYHSQRLRHPFEVVALMLRNHRDIRIVGVNCWTTGGDCRKAYKIFQYPIIVAYSSTVHSVYQGEHSTDHLYRWIVNVRNPLRRVDRMVELETLKKTYHTLVVGYFPFKDMHTPEGYRVFAAAGMMLTTGTSEDDYTCFVVVTRNELAYQLGMRFEGDIQLHIAEGHVFSWSFTKSRTAENVAEWVREKRAEVAPIRWIHFNRNTELMTSQFWHLLNKSSVLLLITPLSRIYRVQPDVSLFSELAKEYRNCEQESILRMNHDSVPSSTPSLNDELLNDKQACSEAREGIVQMDSCCRSLLPSVDWNMACASSVKYHWEDEEKRDEHEAESEGRRRRNHWTEEVLTATNQCVAVRNGSLGANTVLSRCCANYEEFSQLELTRVQRAVASYSLLAREIKVADLCMRSRLHEYMKYPTIDETFGEHGSSYLYTNLSVRGLACTDNRNTLRFAVLDSLHYSYFLEKWGLNDTNLPAVVATTSRLGMFSIMDGIFSQERLRKFIKDFHSHFLPGRLRSEKLNMSLNAIRRPEQVHPRTRQKQSLRRLNLEAFHEQMVNRGNFSKDLVVFFSGGVWHAPSATALHIYHNVANYFTSSKDLIEFCVLDTSRNELPYDFNFDRIPAVVIFTSNQTNTTWKFPELLPISHPNILSFILSHCSSQLRWKIALTNCGRLCVTRNRPRLRRRHDKLLNIIHHIRESPHREVLEDKLQYFVKQLRVVRRVLRVLRIALHQSEALAEETVNSLLHTKVFEEYNRG